MGYTHRECDRYSLGDIRLIVLSSARPSISNAQVEDLQDLWLVLQQDLTLLSENSEIRTFVDAGHYIQFDKPDAVIEAVLDVVQDSEVP